MHSFRSFFVLLNSLSTLLNSLSLLLTYPLITQIGRTGKLTSNKTSHFNELKAESGIDLKHSLFFDDCNWGDHCSVVNKAFGVVGMRTPNGLQWSEWERALEKYTKERG